MDTILTKAKICEALGTSSWRTAKARLKALGIEPVRAGQERLVHASQLEERLCGRATAPQPDWSKLRRTP